MLDAAARLPDSPAPMWIGDVVADRFVIERPSGSGGMGSVFLATDRLDGRPVAVKVLECGESGAVERFHREARVLAELAHPAIVKYVAHGETDAREAFLVMEWVQGDSLQKRLARGCPADQTTSSGRALATSSRVAMIPISRMRRVRTAN